MAFHVIIVHSLINLFVDTHEKRCPIKAQVHQAQVSVQRKGQRDQAVICLPVISDQQRYGNEFGQGIQYLCQDAPG